MDAWTAGYWRERCTFGKLNHTKKYLPFCTALSRRAAFFLTLPNHFSPFPSSGTNYCMPYFQLKLKGTAEDEVTKISNSFRKWKFCKTTESIFPLEYYPTQSVADCYQPGIPGSCEMNKKQSLEERLSYKMEACLFRQFLRKKNPWNWILFFTMWFRFKNASAKAASWSSKKLLNNLVFFNQV